MQISVGDSIKHVSSYAGVRLRPQFVSFAVDSQNAPVDSDSIRYDLLRTGNVEITTNKIIETGYLESVRCRNQSACGAA